MTVSRDPAVDGGRVVYVVVEEPATRATAQRVCAAVLDVLRPVAGRVLVEALSDFRLELPDEVRRAQVDIRVPHVRSGPQRSTSPSELDPAEELHWRPLRVYAGWARAVRVLDPAGRVLGEFADAGSRVTAALTTAEATDVAAAITPLTLEPLTPANRARLEVRRRRTRHRRFERARRTRQAMAEARAHSVGYAPPPPPPHAADGYRVRATARLEPVAGHERLRVLLTLAAAPDGPPPSDTDELESFARGVFDVSLHFRSPGDPLRGDTHPVEVHSGHARLVAGGLVLVAIAQENTPATSPWVRPLEGAEPVGTVPDSPVFERVTLDGEPRGEGSAGCRAASDGWRFLVERAGEGTVEVRAPVVDHRADPSREPAHLLGHVTVTVTLSRR
ncbi:hypothetical protein [Kineococcus sp. NUM-3379]